MIRKAPPERRAGVNSRQIEYWPIAKLHVSVKVRKHTEAQIARISASIQQFGFLSPPLISRTGEIRGGSANLDSGLSGVSA